MENENINIDVLPNRLRRMIEFTAASTYDVESAAGSRIAALILLKNKPIAMGFNSYKTHTLQAKYGKNSEAICIHAEIDAIRKASYHMCADDFKKSTMIIMRTKANRDWGLAKPCLSKNKCAGCQVALAAFGINKVIYSTNTTGLVSYL